MRAVETITGRVTSDVGAPLGGAAVFIAGTNIGAQTNDDGSYTFVVPASRATGATVTLTARVIGYTARSVSIALTPCLGLRVSRWLTRVARNSRA